MRARLKRNEGPLLPKGWPDALRQLLLFAAAYFGYQIVRGLVNGNDVAKASWNATKVINLERTLHVFIEPSVQAWALNEHWLIDVLDVTYLYGHYFVTFGGLLWIYLRRNDSFYFVRNMFMAAMLIALVGYALYPTAPPRLMPEWGFTDTVQAFTGITAERGTSAALLNLYAAIPSMHVCFSLMVGVPLSRFVKHRVVKLLWLMYPLYITFVVIATGNHFLTDAVLGVVTAAVSALVSKEVLARARPHAWAFRSTQLTA